MCVHMRGGVKNRRRENVCVDLAFVVWRQGEKQEA